MVVRTLFLFQMVIFWFVLLLFCFFYQYFFNCNGYIFLCVGYFTFLPPFMPSYFKVSTKNRFLIELNNI